ncbi:RNA pyrophosphohydrolase [Alphaproteobacteria bacterium]|nr:RNA pyrophosphohydrolase [Alphaproteobacteria bacterium]
MPALAKPFRQGVVAVIQNAQGLLWLGRRADSKALQQGGFWQFPQGGLDTPGEPPATAALRETREETGLRRLEVLRVGDFLTAYAFPAEPIAERRLARKYAGQQHRWVLLRFTGADSEVDLSADPSAAKPEFAAWEWATAAQAVERVWDVKRPAYVEGLTKLGLL